MSKVCTPTMHEEIIDIVDKDDVVIGQAPREAFPQHGPVYLRGINVFIENDQGQLWVPRRTATKKLWPLGLDVSIGGCLQAGETYEQGLLREAREEVFLDLNNVAYECVAYLTPIEHNVGCFMKVYKIFLNEVPQYNADDFCEFFWLSPQQLRNKIIQKEPIKPDLSKLLALIYKV